MPATSATKCWTCQNACGGCSWSDHWKHEPVDGWDATPVNLRINGKTENGVYTAVYTPSYIVHECPEYIPDRPRKIDKNRDGRKKK